MSEPDWTPPERTITLASLQRRLSVNRKQAVWLMRQACLHLPLTKGHVDYIKKRYYQPIRSAPKANRKS